MDIRDKLLELDRCDLNCNVFDVYDYDGLSMQELLCQFFNKINECVELSNETIDLSRWLVNEGLKKEVVEKLVSWLNDGTLEHVINVNLFNTLYTQMKTKPTYVIANSFDGANGGEKIQNALNSQHKGGGVKIVVVDSKCDDSDVWLINNPLKIPSNTCLLLNGCYLKLGEGVNNAIINNSNFEGGNNNIHIIGVGNPILDCNRSKQNLSLNNYKNIGLHLYNVDNFSIKGITLKDCARWSLVPEKCTNGIIEDINFDNVGEVNQDGVHIIGPSKNITVSKIRGVVGDDACVVNARLNGQGTNVFQGYGSGGDVTCVTFSDINIEGGKNAHTGILRTSATMNTKIDNITLSNAIGRNLKDGLIRIGGNDLTDINNHGGITISNVIGYGKGENRIALLNIIQPTSNIVVNNAKIYSLRTSIIKTNGNDIKDISLNNVHYEIDKTDQNIDTGGSIFRFEGSHVDNFKATNITYKGVTLLNEAVILQCREAVVNGMSISNLYTNCINGYINKEYSTLNYVRINDCNIVKEGFQENKYNGNLNGVVINNFCRLQGSGELTSETRCDIGDMIRYENTSLGKTFTYLKVANNSYIEIKDSQMYNNKLTKFEIELGTIPSKGYKAININIEDSTNDVFYDFKPGFELRGGLLYSISNRVTGQLKLTVFNAMDSDYTFTQSEKTWIAIKTMSYQ